MKLNSFSLAVAIFVLLFGGIGFTSAMNWWQTETTKTPVKYTEGEAAGQYNPADIRGSYTFGEVSELFDVPLADLQAAFLLPEDVDVESYQLKSLETAYADAGLAVEIGTGSVRMFVAFYKGLPYALDADEESYLFEEAVVILEKQGLLTGEQQVYLKEHAVRMDKAAAVGTTEVAAESTAQPAEIVPQPAATEHAPEEYLVTGKTSFQNLLEWGVTQETIESLLGEAMPDRNMLIKDYSSSKGTTFSELKGKLQAEVDKVKK